MPRRFGYPTASPATFAATRIRQLSHVVDRQTGSGQHPVSRRANWHRCGWVEAARLTG
jgi:hypothetical protein